MLGLAEGIRETVGGREESREFDRDPEVNKPTNLSRFRAVPGWWLGSNEPLLLSAAEDGAGIWDFGVLTPTRRFRCRDICNEASGQ